MATLIPAINPDSITPYGEKRVVKALLRQLPEDALVYHSFETLSSVDRARSAKQKRLQEGEIDVVVVMPGQGVLSLEVKGGGIERDNKTHKWFSINGAGKQNTIQNPFEQARKYSHLLKGRLESALKAQRGKLPFACGYAVVFPDCRWEGSLPADIDNATLADGSDLENLGQFVQTALAKWRNDYHFSQGQQTDMKAIRRVLSGQFDIIPLLSRQIEDEKEQFVRMTDQQKQFLDFASNIDRARVDGVAGSGKTMLAMEQCRRYAEQGMSTLLLCYNKGLSGWLRDALSEDLKSLVTVHHFHEWCNAACDEHQIEFNPANSDSFDAFWSDTAPELLLQCADVSGKQYDAIVIDEGQDFLPDWWIAIDAHLNEEGKFFVFYDQAQDIFEANGMESLEKLQQFTLPTNCRNTRVIADYCGDVLGCEIPTSPMAPQGQAILTISEKKDSVRVSGIEKLVNEWINKDNLKPRQIVIQSPFRKENTCLAEVEELAGVPVTESLDDWYEGKGVLFATIRSFKGREADVVVLVDAPEADVHKAFSRADKYVACSRARSLLVLV